MSESLYGDAKSSTCSGLLTRSTGVDLAEEDLLELVIDGEHTSASNTTEDVGTSTLEEGLDSLLGDDLGASIEHGLVVNTGAGGHHHATTVKDGVSLGT